MIYSLGRSRRLPDKTLASRLGAAYSRGRPRQRIREKCTAQFLINHMVQCELVHLCGGPSGGGKTRWLLPMLYFDWSQGKKVAGHRVYPGPWVYAPMDRPLSSVEESLRTMGIEPWKVDIIPAMDLGYKSITEILDHAEHLQARLVVIEMFAYLLRGYQTPEAIRDFMGAVQRMLKGTGMTIIGTMESPKMKPRDVYRNPRQRISGPASWGHTAETVILVEPNFSDENMRTIGIYTRNDLAEVFDAKFINGRLQITRKRKLKFNVISEG